IRFYKTYRHHLESWHPADCVGEIGAASGARGLIVGMAGLQQGYAPGPVAMCESASDSGLRACCLIARRDHATVPPPVDWWGPGFAVRREQADLALPAT